MAATATSSSDFARYVTRPPLAQDRLELRADGRLELTLKNVWKDGARAVLLEPDDPLVRLCAAVPAPRMHLLRYFGVLSSHNSLRSEVTPTPSPQPGMFTPPPAPGDQLPLPLLAMAWSAELREQVILLNEGLDRAIQFAIRRYSEHRDYIRDRFISILGDDLRNPLNAASLATQAPLESETLAEPERKRALVIARATARMGGLIRDVLDFARGHLGGGIPSTPTACDLGELDGTEASLSAWAGKVVLIREHGVEVHRLARQHERGATSGRL